jgi:hypothetical protein
MQIVFLYGQPACGKLTVGRRLAELTGLPLFHNHLVVDAVAAVFPFGTPSFVRLREQLWLDVMGEAARAGRSLIFTFAPEPTVAAGFPERVRALAAAHGGAVRFVALDVDPDEQARRLADPGRAAFGKLRDLALFETLRDDLAAAMAAMPAPDLRLDLTAASPDAAARSIASALGI